MLWNGMGQERVVNALEWNGLGELLIWNGRELLGKSGLKWYGQGESC